MELVRILSEVLPPKSGCDYRFVRRRLLLFFSRKERKPCP